MCPTHIRRISRTLREAYLEAMGQYALAHTLDAYPQVICFRSEVVVVDVRPSEIEECQRAVPVVEEPVAGQVPRL